MPLLHAGFPSPPLLRKIYKGHSIYEDFPDHTKSEDIFLSFNHLQGVYASLTTLITKKPILQEL